MFKYLDVARVRGSTSFVATQVVAIAQTTMQVNVANTEAEIATSA